METFNSNLFYVGSSTEIKPSPELAGATFWEHNTKDLYKWSSTGWVQIEEGKGLTVLTQEESFISKGQSFEGRHYWSNGIDEVQDFYIVAPVTTTRIYLNVNIHSLSESEYQVYREPTLSDNGIALTAYRKNGNIAYTPELLAYRDPTVTSTTAFPVTLQERWGNGAKVGGSASPRPATILTAGSELLLRVVSRANGNISHINIGWGEEV